jgi:integrase
MIRVRQLANGDLRYDVRLRTPTGRSLSQTFLKRRDAERWQRDQLADRDRGLWVDTRLGKQPMREWYEEWWPRRTELRPSTVARDESYYRVHVLPAFGDLPLAVIDYELVTGWVAELTVRGLAPATVRRCHLLLSKLLAGAVKARRLPRNPCADTDNLPAIERQEMRIVTPAQITALTDAMYVVVLERLARRVPGMRADDRAIHDVAERFAAFVLLAGYGGLRFGELAGLRKEKLDPARRQVRVDTSLIEVRGQLVEGRPKTAAGVRSVPLPLSVVDALEVALRYRQEHEHAFTGADGAPIRAGSFRSRFWNPATRRAGLAGLRMHDLRHTAVSLWIAHGASAKQVQVWAGHRSVATVFDRYGHLFPGGEAPIMEALDATAGFRRRRPLDASEIRHAEVARNRAPYPRHDGPIETVVTPDQNDESPAIAGDP